MLPARIVKQVRQRTAGGTYLSGLRAAVLGRVLGGVGADDTALQPMDLPVDGPEVDAAVGRFAARPKRLSGTLLIIRATREPTPDWLRPPGDQGWGGFSKEVVVHDIPAFHLEVLEEPHVQSLARELARTGP